MWLEAEMVRSLGEKAVGNIDMRYFEHLTDVAQKTIEKFGDFEGFVS